MQNIQEQISEALESGTPVDLQVRNKKIVETSIIGIAANVTLAIIWDADYSFSE